MPRSKSRAAVMSAVSDGSSRCPIPAGRTQAAVSRSYRNAAVRSPRFRLIAVWIGVSTCSRTNAAPTTASDGVKSSPRWTATTRAPIAMAKTAGSTPRNTTAAHQAIASVPPACGSAAKNIHSLRPVSRSIIRAASWRGRHPPVASARSRPAPC